jgi:hypothetical protein
MGRRFRSVIAMRGRYVWASSRSGYAAEESSGAAQRPDDAVLRQPHGEAVA